MQAQTAVVQCCRYSVQCVCVVWVYCVVGTVYSVCVYSVYNVCVCSVGVLCTVWVYSVVGTAAVANSEHTGKTATSEGPHPQGTTYVQARDALIPSSTHVMAWCVPRGKVPCQLTHTKTQVIQSQQKQHNTSRPVFRQTATACMLQTAFPFIKSKSWAIASMLKECPMPAPLTRAHTYTATSSYPSTALPVSPYAYMCAETALTRPHRCCHCAPRTLCTMHVVCHMKSMCTDRQTHPSPSLLSLCAPFQNIAPAKGPSVAELFATN